MPGSPFALCSFLLFFFSQKGLFFPVSTQLSGSLSESPPGICGKQIDTHSFKSVFSTCTHALCLHKCHTDALLQVHVAGGERRLE